MLIKDIEGLKFPDDFVTRFFFKEGLDKRRGRVLELGCDTGHNLMMFYQYGWDITGVDIDKGSIKKARNNFDRCQKEYKLTNTYKFFVKDMENFAARRRHAAFDVLLIPSSADYLEYPRLERLFSLIKGNGIVKVNSLIFVRFRTPQDYRYARGKRCGERTFKLTIRETGEYGCMMTFLSESELTALLEKNFRFRDKHLFHCRFDNLQKEHMVSNYNIIFWGRVKGLR